MDRKLCQEDPKTTEFTASVIETEKDSKGWKVRLDQTYFYPEGGGQPSDHGWIGDIEVFDVQESNGDIYHRTGQEPPKAALLCRVDQERRLEYMQQHTGQHIISSALWQVGKYATVSVHMGETHTTIELATPDISTEHLREVEALSNRLINRNLPIKIVHTDSSKLGNFNLRKPVTVDGNIRLVCIEGVDCVGCCGLHLERTGEAGLVKYTHTEKIRGHTRISWKIGDRAYRDYEQKVVLNHRLKTLLSTGEEMFEDKIRQIQEELVEHHRLNNQLENRLADTMARDLISRLSARKKEDARVVTGSFKGEPDSLIKKIAKGLMDEKNIYFCIINKTPEKLTWLMGCSQDRTLPFEKIRQECLPLINGKGGGRHPLWQGMGDRSGNGEEFLKSFIRQLDKLF